MSFIFQAVPERYDLRKELRPGARVSWLATRYQDQMRAGDVVYLWLAGSPSIRGIYGWGLLVGDVTRQVRQERVLVEYQRSFLEHKPPDFIPATVVAQDPVLGESLIIRAPMGTNFPLTTAQDRALRAIIAQRLGEAWLPPEPGQRPGS
jgi:hypothetical protein